MRIPVIGAICVVAAIGCGSRSSRETSGLKIVVADTPTEIVAGSTLAVQVLVMGAGASEAVISSPDLPAFATLAGSLLSLSPTRDYEGDYPITLVATAGSNTASALLDVHVTRPNSAPEFDFFVMPMYDGDLERSISTCPGAYCTIQGLATLEPWIKDDDLDAMTVEIEIVPFSEPFEGVATYSSTVSPGNTTAHCGSMAPYACVEFPFPGLVPGTSYKWALRIRDAVGAWGGASGWEQGADHWIPFPMRMFDQGPCPSGVVCACAPSARYCQDDVDCCSGTCLRGGGNWVCL